MTDQELIDKYLGRIAGLAAALSSKAESLSEEARLGSGSNTRDPDVELLCDTLRLWAEFLSNTHVQGAYAESAVMRSEFTWVDGGLLQQIEDKVASLTHPLDRKWGAVVSNEFRMFLRSIVQRSDFLEPMLPGDGGTEFLKFKYATLLRLQDLDGRSLERSVVRANEAAAESEKGRDASTRAASKAGEDAMSRHYADMAKIETERADLFRKLTIGFAMAAGTAALIFVLVPIGFLLPGANNNDIVHAIQRAVFVAGVFGIGGYFARQAHQHRSMANWAGSLAVQLQTFDAYIAAVDDKDVRDDLRKSFAARAFGDHPGIKGEPAVAPSTAAMDTAIEWAGNIASKVSGAGK